MRQKDVDREAKSSTEVNHDEAREGLVSVFPQPEREKGSQSKSNKMKK